MACHPRDWKNRSQHSMLDDVTGLLTYLPTTCMCTPLGNWWPTPWLQGFVHPPYQVIYHGYIPVRIPTSKQDQVGRLRVRTEKGSWSKLRRDFVRQAHDRKWLLRSTEVTSIRFFSMNTWRHEQHGRWSAHLECPQIHSFVASHFPGFSIVFWVVSAPGRAHCRWLLSHGQQKYVHSSPLNLPWRPLVL